MLDFGVFFGLHVCRVISAAAGLQRTNLTACEAIKCRHLKNKFADHERKSSRSFQANCKGGRKIGCRSSRCAALKKSHTGLTMLRKHKVYFTSAVFD